MGVIYLVRHGQADPRAYGSSNHAPGSVGLTDLGRQQARLTGQALATRIGRPTAAICGNLARQRETLAGVLAEMPTDIAAQHVPLWDEYDIDAVLGGGDLAVTEAGRGLQQVLDAALEDWVDRPPTDENRFEDFGGYRRRCAAALDSARQLAGPGETVLVVSSSGTITQILAQIWEMAPRNWIQMSRTMVNAAVTKLIVGHSGVSVVSVNEHAHLDLPDHHGARTAMTFR